MSNRDEDDPRTETGMFLRDAVSNAEDLGGWDHLPCAREHLPGTICTLPEGHPQIERGWTVDYEEVDGPDVDLSHATMVGGFGLRTALMPVGEGEAARSYPMLIFDFHGAAGQPIRPIALVMDEEELQGVSRLIGNAAHGAVEAARRADGRDPRTGRKRGRS